MNSVFGHKLSASMLVSAVLRDVPLAVGGAR